MAEWFDGLNEVKVIGMDGKTQITINIDTILNVDAGNLLEESAKLSRYYAYISNLACESERRSSQYDILMSNKIANISQKTREENSDKKLTVSMMTELMDTNEEVNKLKNELLRRQTETKKLFKLSRSIELKDKSIQNLTKILQSEWFMEFNANKDNAVSSFINSGKYEQYMKTPEETTEED